MHPSHGDSSFIGMSVPPMRESLSHAQQHNIICIASQPVTTYLNSTINDSSTRPSGSSESDIRNNSSAHSLAPSCMPAIVRSQQEQLYPDVYKQNPMTKANIFGNADAIDTAANTLRPLQTLPSQHPYSKGQPTLASSNIDSRSSYPNTTAGLDANKSDNTCPTSM
ncbi:hypothetical protein Tco_0373299 [Tanacetum coccineum]